MSHSTTHHTHETAPLHDPVDAWHDHSHDPKPQQAHAEVGNAGAIMGIGGAFLLVPMLIYFLRVPTATVIGTSTMLTLVTMGSATIMHATTNHLVDVMLALILLASIGAITACSASSAGWYSTQSWGAP